MATILRKWSYQYQWLYDTIAQLSALAVGGEARFRQLALKGLNLDQHSQILDLCCGAGQTTQFLLQYSHHVTGLDASPLALERAKKRAPEANYVEGLAEELPFASASFDLVQTSVALHEMTPKQLTQILTEVYRVLKLGGIFACIDLHQPHNPIFVPGLAIFMTLFETETAWEFVKINLSEKLSAIGFKDCQQTFYAGGSLQVVQGKK
ncbi:Methyltransferase type 11 [Halothece sp. PCC 7418]|uniref:class I SAM-dependent methyltransferase n=1 Tax=Halothece sp. (strain PCC 7418) TaxID=65093 RepID=UPI0002A05B7D|nr:class I SAM-dependent methyltransferase [Halothece sp. PCC 7418]AFZ44805.1 Methyltransferase type 11 [Halothece sp. PCC 7418]